jgi:hypothetical protein
MESFMEAAKVQNLAEEIQEKKYLCEEYDTEDI